MRAVCVLLFALAVVLVSADESAGPFTYKYEQEKKKQFDAKRAALNPKKPEKTFKPKDFMHRRHIKIVPKGDPRAYPPIYGVLRSDASPLIGAAADLFTLYGQTTPDAVVGGAAPSISPTASVPGGAARLPTRKR